MPFPVWQVDLYVEGAISMRQRWQGQQQKGFLIEDPFYSDIEIQTIPATASKRPQNRCFPPCFVLDSQRGILWQQPLST
jgi:hypothetical protein